MIETILKVGSKLVVLLGAFGAIIGAFSLIPFPLTNLSPVADMLNTIYTICSHWFPYFNIIWQFSLTMLSLQITIWLIKPAIIAYHWLDSLWD